MKKKTNTFDKLDNVIGNYQENKASMINVISAAINVNKYLIQHPHPHDVFLGAIPDYTDVSNIIDGLRTIGVIKGETREDVFKALTQLQKDGKCTMADLPDDVY